MKLLIAGSRNMDVRQEVKQFVASLPSDTIIINGGAAGVDDEAAIAARAYGLHVELYLPDWKKYGKSAGVIRNAKMVEEADYVVCFWDGKSKGTSDTVRRAKQAGKLLAVVSPKQSAIWDIIKPGQQLSLL